MPPPHFLYVRAPTVFPPLLLPKTGYSKNRFDGKSAIYGKTDAENFKFNTSPLPWDIEQPYKQPLHSSSISRSSENVTKCIYRSPLFFALLPFLLFTPSERNTKAEKGLVPPPEGREEGKGERNFFCFGHFSLEEKKFAFFPPKIRFTCWHTQQTF